jgi:hypothetical protein
MLSDIVERLTCIRSSLGSGKTKYLQEQIESGRYNTVLIVSHRKSFTLDLSRRLGFKTYSELSGPIDTTRFPRCIVQVESLHRVHSSGVTLLVLDELESLLDQLSNGVAIKLQAHHTLLHLLQNS